MLVGIINPSRLLAAPYPSSLIAPAQRRFAALSVCWPLAKDGSIHPRSLRIRPIHWSVEAASDLVVPRQRRHGENLPENRRRLLIALTEREWWFSSTVPPSRRARAITEHCGNYLSYFSNFPTAQNPLSVQRCEKKGDQDKSPTHLLYRYRGSQMSPIPRNNASPHVRTKLSMRS
jgi:hypothetical protein